MSGWDGVQGKHKLKSGEARLSFYAEDYGAPAAHRGRYGEPGHFRSRNPCSKSRSAYVRVGPLRALLARMVSELGIPTVAALAGTSPRSLYRIMNESVYVTWQLADRLICDVLDDPSLWYTEPGLELRNLKGEPL